MTLRLDRRKNNMIHLKIKPLEKAKHLNQASIFRFHVGFRGRPQGQKLPACTWNTVVGKWFCVGKRQVRTASFWTSIIYIYIYIHIYIYIYISCDHNRSKSEILSQTCFSEPSPIKTKDISTLTRKTSQFTSQLRPLPPPPPPRNEPQQVGLYCVPGKSFDLSVWN